MATLKITVHEARDLPIMDRTTGLADPYVVVKLDDMEHTTDIVRRTRNPVWEHDVRFDTADLLVLQEDPLEIRVYDHDIISRDDIVGMVLLDCNCIIYRDNPTMSGWFPLLDSDAGLHGDIRLTIRIKFHAAENPLAPTLPERFVRRLDPRITEQLSHPSPLVPPATTTAAMATINTNNNTNNSNSKSSEQGNDVNICLSTIPPPESNIAMGYANSPVSSHTVDQGASLSFTQRGTAQSNNGPATSFSATANVKVPHSRRHVGLSSHHNSVAQPSRSQLQQSSHTVMSPFLNPGTSPSTFANGSSSHNNLNVPGNYVENANALQIPSSTLFPFRVEQDLNPLQAARVDHPTLAAEEEGVFVFSVWRLDPAVFRVERTHSMMEELIVKSDPEHVRFTNLRSSRSINDARVIQLFKLSGKVRRQLARKVVELQCNAVLGYVEEFDMEPNGIIVRAYGTPCVVSKVKYVEEREMQNFLRSKSRYLQASVAAAYQSELAQQLQRSPLPLSHGASLLPTGGTSTANMSSGPTNVGGPTYFPPSSTIHSCVSAGQLSPPTLIASNTTTAAASQDLHSTSSSTVRPQQLISPLMTHDAVTTINDTNNHNNSSNTTWSAAAREHFLPPPMVPLTNASIETAGMPPEMTSTAAQASATVSDHHTTGSVHGGDCDESPAAVQSQFLLPLITVDDGNNGGAAAALAAAGSLASSPDIAAVASNALVATLVSASSTGTPTYAKAATERAAVAAAAAAMAASQLRNTRAGTLESTVGTTAVGGSGGTPSTMVPPAAQMNSPAVVAGGGNNALSTPARVIISMLTVKDLPAGAIHHIGGYICARSVKIVSRVKSRQMISQERDAWWMELREELRANARAFHCNTVLGYEEETQYHEDVVLLSLYGTAVMLDVSITSLRAGPEYLFRQQRQCVAAKRNCALLHLYEGQRRKSGHQGLAMLAGEVSDLVLHHECGICHNKPVPEVLLAACTLPVELSCEAPPRLVQVAVSKTKPNVKGVELAMAVSQALPFIEFALHKQLLFNLRLQQMNACFALRVSIVVGPDAIIGTLTGSGCRLAGLPVPRLPRMSVMDPLLANKESVVKLRDVIASRHRRHCNRNSSSSSSSNRSSSSSSSSTSSRSNDSSFSHLSVSARRKRLATPHSALTKGFERSGRAARVGSVDNVRAVVAAVQHHPDNNTSNSTSSLNSASISKRCNQHPHGQQQKPKQPQRHHYRSSRLRRHSHKHGSADTSMSTCSTSADSKSDAPSHSTSSAGASLNNVLQGHRVKKKHRTRKRIINTNNDNSNSVSVGGGENVKRPSHSLPDSATNSDSPPAASSAFSSRSHTSSLSSSRSHSSTSSRSSRSSSSSFSHLSNSWVPTESSESDEDIYAPADGWHASSRGARTKTSDYVVRIDDAEEADMLLGMIDSTNFEDGVLLTLPYVPDSANAFDWQERIVLDRRYARASASPFLGGGGAGANGSTNMNSAASGGYDDFYGGTLRSTTSNNTFASGNNRSDGGGQRRGTVAFGGGGADGMKALNSSSSSAATGRTALTTRLLNEYCADAKRAFVHRACRLAMRAHQPLRLRVVNLRVEMTFVPNSADLQLRLEGCVMVASSAGARQLRALEDRAFRVCMHYTLESLSGLWQYQQQQQLQSQASCSNAGGGPLISAPHFNGGQLPVTSINANSSGRATPRWQWDWNTPVLSPMMGGDVGGHSTNSNLNNNTFLSFPDQQLQQQQSAGLGFPVPHSSSTHNHLTSSTGSKPTMNALLPLAEYGPAYLDARRLFVTCNAPFSLPYVQDITLPPPRVWSGAATALSEDTATSPRHTSTYAEYHDSRSSRTASLARRWNAFVRATGQSIKGLLDRATGGTGDRVDRRLQQQRKWLSSTTDGNSMNVPDGVGALPNGSVDLSMAGLRDANYSHPAARLPQDMSQLLQLIPVVLFTPLDYVAGRSIVRYLGRLSQHFIREGYDADTGDDLNVFFQRAEMESMCMVQAVVRLMGGNAMLKHRIVYHEICDSDGSGSAFLFATVTGDVVQVSEVEFAGPNPREEHTKKHHSNMYDKSKSKRGGGGGGDGVMNSNEEGSMHRSCQHNEDAADDSDKERNLSAAVKRRKSHCGTSRRHSSRRHRSRAHHHRRCHHRSSSSSSSSSSASTSGSRDTVSSTTNNSGTPSPSGNSGIRVGRG